MNSQARIETHQALQALEDLDDCARMDVGISATGPYDLLRRYIQQQDRLALSHAAGQEAVAKAAPAPNWCRTCGKRPDDPAAIFCSDSFHRQPTHPRTCPSWEG